MKVEFLLAIQLFNCLLSPGYCRVELSQLAIEFLMVNLGLLQLLLELQPGSALPDHSGHHRYHQRYQHIGCGQ